MEHISRQIIEEYHQKKLTDVRLLELDDHITLCDPCRDQLYEDKNRLNEIITSVIKDLSYVSISNIHLSYEQLEKCVKDELNEAELGIVNFHLMSCSQCVDEMTDLRKFKNTIDSYSSYMECSDIIQPTFFERIAGFWQFSPFRFSFQIIAIAIVVGLPILLVVNRFQNKIINLQERAGHLEKANEILEKQASSSKNLKEQLIQLRNEKEKISQEATVTKNTLTDTQVRLEHLNRIKVKSIQNDSVETDTRLNDQGNSIELDKQGNPSGLDFVSKDDRIAAKLALSVQKVQTPKVLTELTTKAEVFLGLDRDNKPSFSLVSPVGTVVRTDRPIFQWQPVKGATTYVVAVYDSNFSEVLTSPVVLGEKWISTEVLEGGKVYSWQVTAFKDGDKTTSLQVYSSGEKFKVLEQDAVNNLKSLEQSYANSYLMLGIIYARMGLLDEAVKELGLLSDANPQSSSARKLLLQVKTLRQLHK